MVSKVAVIAIVAILAVPILLGYALNLEETTETGYKAAGDPVNVTPYLQNGTIYNYAHGDSYILNTNLRMGGGYEMIPVYERVSSVHAAYNLQQTFLQNRTFNNETEYFNDYTYYYLQADYVYPSNNIGVTYYYTYNGVEYNAYAGGFHSVYYNAAMDKFIISYYSGSSSMGFTNVYGQLSRITFNGGPADVHYEYYDGSERYADISQGFYFYGSVSDWQVALSPETKYILFTMDLNSITDPNYSINLRSAYSGYSLEKSTVGSVVTWSLRDLSDPTRTIDLYYDSTRLSNTYQVYWDLTETSQDSSYAYYSSHREFRYVGNWPNLIGEANSYMTITDDVVLQRALADPALSMDYFSFTDSSNRRSPTIRVDDSYFRAFEHPIIANQLYNPAAFKVNPSTTITDIQLYGSSITFGGVTYTVKDGNITLEARQIPIKDLVFTSAPGDDGNYENKIGNTLISTSINPSMLIFSGNWSASISTQSMEPYNITKTKWIPGGFAWDGMDQNFIMVGLLASLGAFVGVGIYARRTRSSVWPLLIVCGGAALLFFVML